jgi:hypothetical protein
MDQKIGQMEGGTTVADRLDKQDHQISNLNQKLDDIISLLRARQQPQ